MKVISFSSALLSIAMVIVLTQLYFSMRESVSQDENMMGFLLAGIGLSVVLFGLSILLLFHTVKSRPGNYSPMPFTPANM